MPDLIRHPGRLWSVDATLDDKKSLDTLATRQQAKDHLGLDSGLRRNDETRVLV
ncbi:MAG TPA: hypothetical protein VHO84_05495 [Syntrophorhabdaceae bacterium]|nr:hypothetical protein [Syntrophorhabdaceae bacterium]